MPPFRTHYSNLKISRDAPPEVVKAAYKALSSRWHPDRNPGNPEAGRVMALINESYAVLSDPEKRAEHDRWILRQELTLKAGVVPPAEPEAAQEQPSTSPELKETRFDRYARMDPLLTGAQRGAAAYYRSVAAELEQKPYQAVARDSREPLIPDLGRTLLTLAVLLYLIWLLR